ncbi:SNF2 family, partial [gut metagenome]
MQTATNPVLLNSSLDDVTDDNGCKIIESEEDKDFLSSIQRFIKDEVPEKFKKALELTQSIISEGGKVIVWASYIKNIEMLCDFFIANGIAVRKLYGATPVETSEEDCLICETRESIVREFNSDHSSFNVIVANPFAVAESIS